MHGLDSVKSGTIALYNYLYVSCRGKIKSVQFEIGNDSQHFDSSNDILHGYIESSSEPFVNYHKETCMAHGFMKSRK